MLTSIKGKFKFINVTKNVSFLTASNDPVEKQPNIPVNLKAGAELLSHYQEQWFELHNLNEVNAKSAQELDELILQIQAKSDNDRANFNRIAQTLTNTPSLKDSVDKCVAQIASLYESFDTVENALIKLEDLIEQVELEEKKNEHRKQLDLYKQKRIANLESVRCTLGANHMQNITEHELKRKKEMEERQQVFQEAFKSDLEVYKKYGAIPKIDIPKQQSALLEEMTIDFDPKELDQFFEDNNS